jgi:thiamine kinase
MLYHLHQQPRLGWRSRYTRCLNATGRPRLTGARRVAGTLKRLRKAGEPQPLRLAPLHMDVHAGNIVHTAGLRLIDWEYAGDGDVALELAAVWTESDDARQSLSGTTPRWRTLTPTR